MFKKNKKIVFFPTTLDASITTEPPSLSKNHLPEAYKKLSKKIDKNKPSLFPNLLNTNLTAKACVPLMDTFTAGYMVTLPCDLTVTKNEEYYRIYWEVNWEVVKTHSYMQINEMEIPFGFEKSPFKFETRWVIKTPPGYSCLITHPFNRFDLPFLTLTGIVDTDTYNILPINLPFFLKEDFEGVIKKGTPIAQVIPFKRESWKSKINEYEKKMDNEHQINVLKSVSENSYKKRFWQRKKYE